jgi:hypothetical protein
MNVRYYPLPIHDPIARSEMRCESCGNHTATHEAFDDADNVIFVCSCCIIDNPDGE